MKTKFLILGIVELFAVVWISTLINDSAAPNGLLYIAAGALVVLALNNFHKYFKNK